VRRADSLTTLMCRLSKNLGVSTSWSPKGLPRPVMGLLYLYLTPTFLVGEGPRIRCYGRTAALRLIVQPCDEDEDEQFLYQVLRVMDHQWNEIDRGKPTTCPNATLSTTNLTWTDLGSNPGLRGERPATNRLSHGTAYTYVVKCF
jgi:hypothetical protein